MWIVDIDIMYVKVAMEMELYYILIYQLLLYWADGMQNTA